MITCVVCKEYLAGDGHNTVLHCPDAPPELVEGAEPDAPAIFCEQVSEPYDE